MMVHLLDLSCCTLDFDLDLQPHLVLVQGRPMLWLVDLVEPPSLWLELNLNRP